MQDIMSAMAAVYRIEVVSAGDGFKGVILHKPTGKRMTVNVECATESGAVLATRAMLTGAIKRGTLPL